MSTQYIHHTLPAYIQKQMPHQDLDDILFNLIDSVKLSEVISGQAAQKVSIEVVKAVATIVFIDLSNIRVKHMPCTKKEFDRIAGLEKLLKEPEYQPILNHIIKGLLQKSFKDIRILALWYEYPKLPSHKGFVPVESLTEQVVCSAWTLEYQGDLLEKLHQWVCKHTYAGKYSKPFSNFGVWLQSSGYGKSRTIKEYGNKVFTINLNIRSSQPDEDIAQPPTHSGLRDYLLKLLHSQDGHDQQEVVFLKFLKAVFTVTEKILRISLNKQQKLSYNDIASQWNIWQSKPGHSNDFCNRIVEQMQHADQTRSSTRNKAFDQTDFGRPTSEKWKMAALGARTSFTSLSKCIQGLQPKPCLPDSMDHPQVIFCVDEVDVLAREFTDEFHKTTRLYDVFCESLSALLGSSIFFLFLTTDAQASHLTPPKWLLVERSYYAFKHFNNLVPPFTGYWNVYLPDNTTINGLSLDNFSSASFLVQFGRCMWYAYSKGVHNPEGVTPEDLLIMAKGKLLAKTTIPPFREWTTEQKLTILDFCVCIRLEVYRNNYIAENADHKLTANHMRTICHIPKSRETVYSTYKSEPILGEAATNLLYQIMKEGNIKGILEIISYSIYRDLAVAGEGAEIFMRILCHLAMMSAISKLNQDWKMNTILFSQGCAIEDFIKELFHDEWAQNILQCKGNDIVSFSETFEGARLRFTQWLRLGDDVMNTTRLGAAWAEGYALIVRHSTVGYDAYIPVLMNVEEGFQPDNLSVIMVSVKATATPPTMGALQFDSLKDNVILKKAQHCIIIHMHLAPESAADQVEAEGEQRSHTYPVQNQNTLGFKFKPPTTEDISSGKNQPAYDPSVTCKVFPDRKGMARDEPDERHIYQIVVHGCSSKIFKVMDPLYDDFVRELLRQPRIRTSARPTPEDMEKMGTEMHHWSTYGRYYEHTE
ncbi:hypothetical protein C8Q74DRAFT_1220011 [Fomes fomentarius]|nr:hypothetical protein C8Q74DRAFT_1220011 [Fomes fomentarius]